MAASMKKPIEEVEEISLFSPLVDTLMSHVVEIISGPASVSRSSSRSEGPTAEEEDEGNRGRRNGRRQEAAAQRRAGEVPGDELRKGAQAESCRKLHLATEIGLDPKQVAVWFQIRRARWKSKQLEDEYVRLRSSHDTALVEKCRLENEVLMLRDKLAKSEEEIKRLASFAEGCVGSVESAVVGSPSSSLTSATHLGEFGMEEADEIYATASYGDRYYYLMELGYLYGM
ncbi:hypothetical protein HPP92_006085 [Vanilla planifolia]|uniref:Homeobox-leucine zipper protein n=1 Tax=Vanilla planifolia TaxID=51239 RepID=A0A835RV96_VANPL|nr:hypothetical protein HPP92_006085 [Vanilla planifolia]